MARYSKKRSKKEGSSPGTIVYTGDIKEKPIRIDIIDYSDSEYEEKQVNTVEECFQFKDKKSVTWINITGIHNTEAIEKIGGHFGVHPLILEDIANPDQRPKTEEGDGYIFTVMKMVYFNKKKEIESEQISFILGSNFVISFQELEGDIFDKIRDRIKNAKGKVRKLGADYLKYALIDRIVDNYFTILEEVGDHIEAMEDKVITASENSSNMWNEIHNLKRELILLRKSVWPLREVLSGLQRTESRLINKSTKVYLRDVYDHTIQIIDTIETFKEMASGLLETYLSSISNKMNEVMKVLTIIATIFIPLTFIAGVYGMNFKYMPEIGWKYGYYTIWGVMTAMALVMVAYFRKKKWL